MKKCPFCAEDVQDAAIVCKHCGRDIKKGKGAASLLWKESPNAGVVARSAVAATRACPFCKATIPLAAQTCPSCGDDVSGSARASGAVAAMPAAAMPGKSNPTQKAGIGCAVVFLLTLGGCWLIGSLNNTPEAQRKKVEDNAKVVVTVLCEQAVKQRLKAPGTADFPFGDATNVEVLGSNRYRLRSYVDAQNAFGAKLRNNFACTVEGSGEDASGYKVTELTGLN